MHKQIKEARQRAVERAKKHGIGSLLAVIDKEIKWGKDHYKDFYNYIDPKYKEGFIQGLMESKYLILKWKDPIKEYSEEELEELGIIRRRVKNLG